MPNIKSAAKRMRQNARIRLTNRSRRADMRTHVKKIRAAIAAGDAQAAAAMLPQIASVLGHAAQKKIIHKNAAARHIARLSHQVHALEQAQSATS